MTTKKALKNKARKISLQKTVLRPIILIPLALIIIAAAAMYLIVLPRQAAADYRQATDRPTADLIRTFEDIEKNADLTVLAEADPRQAAIEQAARARLDTAKRQLADLRKANDMLAPLPFAYSNKTYQNARVDKRNHDYAISQSQAVIADYEKLITYLKQHGQHVAVLKDHLQTFNAVSDLNSLNGTAAEQRRKASDIDAAAAAIKAMGPPPGTTGPSADPTITFQQASAGFRRLADAVARSSDTETNRAATDLEAATARLTEVDTPALLQAVQTSAVIRQVRELSEKFESI